MSERVSDEDLDESIKELESYGTHKKNGLYLALKELRALRASQASAKPEEIWYDPSHDCENHCAMCKAFKARLPPPSDSKEAQ